MFCFYKNIKARMRMKSWICISVTWSLHWLLSELLFWLFNWVLLWWTHRGIVKQHLQLFEPFVFTFNSNIFLVIHLVFGDSQVCTTSMATLSSTVLCGIWGLQVSHTCSVVIMTSFWHRDKVNDANYPWVDILSFLLIYWLVINFIRDLH